MLEAIRERARLDAAEIKERLDEALEPLAFVREDVVRLLT